jgi:hypothetical protein
MADYSTDAAFFSPDGALRGPEAIRGVFEKLFSEFSKPGASLTPRLTLIEREYVYVTWTAETPDNWYELASDLFVIQNGQIRMQAFTASVRPKR